MFERFIEKLKKGLDKKEFLKYSKKMYPDFDFDAAFEFLKFQGLPLEIKNDKVYLATAIRPYTDFVYTVVDLEVNNSKPKEGQIIEIGAVKLKNFEVIDEFNALVFSKEVPKYVTKVTGIDEEMLKNEKSQKEILQQFRLFLKDSIFVAHAADFDFYFLANQFEKENLGWLLNRHLCTISLARKTIPADRYGLKYLKEELNLPKEMDHRALSDARSAKEIFLLSLQTLPKEIITAEDLIEFGKPSKNKC